MTQKTKILLALDTAIHKELKLIAQYNRRSLTAQINHILELHTIRLKGLSNAK